MADYSVPNGHVGVHAKTLAANVVDVVTFVVGGSGSPGWARVPQAVEVLTDGTADIYVTVDGSTPTVAGTNCWRVPALAGSSVVDVRDSVRDDPVVVKLVSAGAPVYSVSRATL